MGRCQVKCSFVLECHVFLHVTPLSLHFLPIPQICILICIYIFYLHLSVFTFVFAFTFVFEFDNPVAGHFAKVVFNTYLVHIHEEQCHEVSLIDEILNCMFDKFFQHGE